MNHPTAPAELALRTVDHVDVQLAIAGLGARAYAYMIDWHIRIGVALAAASLGWLAAWLADASHFLEMAALGLPAGLLFLVYHPVLEIVQQGRTPGKRTAGLRIVTTEGEVPGVGAILVRNVFRVIDCLPGLYSVAVIVMFFTARQTRLGDLASGTLVIYDEQRKTASKELIGSAQLSPQKAMLIRELIDRWAELDADKRQRLAIQMLRQADQADPVGDDMALLAALRARIERVAA